MSSISFTVLAHDLASRVFRGIGNAALAMAAKVRAASAIAGGSAAGFQRNAAAQTVMQRAYVRSAMAAGRLNRAMSFMTGGSMTAHARLWFRVILAGLLMMPAVIGPALVGLGALTGAFVSVIPGAVALGAAMAGIWQRIKKVADGSREATGPLRAAADALNRVKEVWKEFLNATQGAVSNVFTQGFKLLAELLPRLVPMTRTFAKVFSDFIKDIRLDMRGPEFARALRWLKDIGALTFNNILRTGRNLIEFLYHIGRAFDAAGIDVTLGWLERMTDGWVKWARSLRHSKGFRDFVEYIKTQWPKLVEIFKNLATTLGNMWEGFAPISSDVLDLFVKLTERLSRISPGTWEAIGRGFLALAAGVKVLGLAMAVLTPARIAAILRLGRLAFTPWSAIALGIGLVGAALLRLYQTSPKARKFFHAFFDPWSMFALRMTRLAQRIPNMYAKVAAAIVAGSLNVRDAFAEGMSAFRDPSGTLAKILSGFTLRIYTAFNRLANRVRPIFSRLAGRVASAFTNMAVRAMGATGRIRSAFVSLAARIASAVTRIIARLMSMSLRGRLTATAMVNAFRRVDTRARLMAGLVVGAVGRVIARLLALGQRAAAVATRVVTSFIRIATRGGGMRERVAGAITRIIARLNAMAARAAAVATRIALSFMRIIVRGAAMAARIANSSNRIRTVLRLAANAAANFAGRVIGRFNAVIDAIIRVMTRITALRDLIGSLRDKTITVTTNLVTNTISNIIRNVLPGRQHGGPVRRGTPYIVGEVGPEVFVPNQSGTIVPNHQMRGGGGKDSALMSVLVARVEALVAATEAMHASLDALPRRQVAYARQGGGR